MRLFLQSPPAPSPVRGRWMPLHAPLGASIGSTMIRERLGPDHRLRTSLEYARVKAEGRALRGRNCLVLALDVPGEPTRIGFIASKKGVGNAVQRNRARRRLREIVRRRFPCVSHQGHWLAFIAFRTSTTVPHAELVADVEALMVQAGALAAPLAGAAQ